MTSAKLPGAGRYRVEVQAWRAGDPKARFGFSAPRLLRGDNRSPATQAEVRKAIKDAYDEVESALPWMCEVADLAVERLDIARDFEDVVDGPLLLEGLSTVPPLRMDTHLYRSRDHRGVQTVLRETTRHRGQLYCRDFHYLDRAASARSPKRELLEALAAADKGVVRFELGLRHEQATELGVGTVADLVPARLADIAKRFFIERCRFSEVIAGPAWKMRKAAESLVAAGSGKSVVTALGQMMADALGIEAGRHPKVAAVYRKKYRDMGLNPGDLWVPERAPVRFDWRLGRVVDVADADRRAA